MQWFLANYIQSTETILLRKTNNDSICKYRLHWLYANTKNQINSSLGNTSKIISKRLTKLRGQAPGHITFWSAQFLLQKCGSGGDPQQKLCGIRPDRKLTSNFPLHKQSRNRLINWSPKAKNKLMLKCTLSLVLMPFRLYSWFPKTATKFMEIEELAF